MGNFLGQIQQYNEKKSCICILINTCDGSVIAAITAVETHVFLIALLTD